MPDAPEPVTFALRPMRDDEAAVVAGWHYEPPYDLYDAAADPESLARLLGEKPRERVPFSVLLEGELIGFFTFALEDGDLEIGLGLAPERVGRGEGLRFLEAGLEFGRAEFAPKRFRLSVATFNERAIRVYGRAGFQTVGTFEEEHAGAVHTFLEMVRPAAS